MSYDSPLAEKADPEEYYKKLKEEVGEETVKKLNPIFDDLTVDQLHCLERYINECCRNMSARMEKNITMKDYEVAKGDDVDEDDEEGE
jgi:hypothetical protein